MVTLTFLKKELVEHGLAIAALVIAVMVALFITLARQQNQEFSISPLEILNFALFTFIPLAAFILGNRLIERDYRSKAQLFTESLPTRRFIPVFIKYLLGAFVVLGLMLVTLVMAARYASVVDSITPAYFGLLALKTLSVALLYWAIMFAISLSGHLRLLLYVLLLGTIYYLLTTRSVDVTDFGPFALLMDGTLAYERVQVPLKALQETWAMTAAFSAIGFLIALWHEGSMAEVLARPMARRDYLMIGFIVAAFLTVLGILEKEPTPDPFPIDTRYQIKSERHAITAAYLDDAAKSNAELVVAGLDSDIDRLQATVGPVDLAPSYLVHSDTLQPWEFIATSADGPLLYGNMITAQHYDRVVFRTTVLHQLLLATSGGRAVFEHFHWFLDGYTRHLTEASTAASTTGEREASREELLARAVISYEVLGNETDLIRQWQSIADRLGYASAESLAYSALMYLQELEGEVVIDELASRWLISSFERDTRASLRRWRQGVEAEFKAVTGIDWNDFMAGWRAWLPGIASNPGVAQRVDALNYRAGSVAIIENDLAGELLLGSFASTENRLPAAEDFEFLDTPPALPGDDNSSVDEHVCILNYSAATAFDTEMDFVFDDFEESPCGEDPFTVFDYNIAGSGDRLYITAEVRLPAFHQPIRLHAERVTVP